MQRDERRLDDAVSALDNYRKTHAPAEPDLFTTIQAVTDAGGEVRKLEVLDAIVEVECGATISGAELDHDRAVIERNAGTQPADEWASSGRGQTSDPLAPHNPRPPGHRRREVVRLGLCTDYEGSVQVREKRS